MSQTPAEGQVTLFTAVRPVPACVLQTLGQISYCMQLQARTSVLPSCCQRIEQVAGCGCRGEGGGGGRGQGTCGHHCCSPHPSACSWHNPSLCVCSVQQGIAAEAQRQQGGVRSAAHTHAVTACATHGKQPGKQICACNHRSAQGSDQNVARVVHDISAC